MSIYHHRTHQQNKGLSLAELLVVAGIITMLGVLAFSILPGVGGAALQIKCKNNLKELGTALFLYGEQNDDHLPDFRYSRWCGAVHETDPRVYTWNTLADGTIVWFIDERTHQSFVCPAQTVPALNTQGIRSHYAGLSIHSFKSLSGFDDASSTVLLFEYEPDPGQVLDSRGTQQRISYAYDSFEPGTDLSVTVAHKSQGHILFADQRVELVSGDMSRIQYWHDVYVHAR